MTSDEDALTKHAKQIALAAILYTQMENFINRSPGSMTGFSVTEALTYPVDFITAGTIIAEKLERLASSYRNWVEELKHER